MVTSPTPKLLPQTVTSSSQSTFFFAFKTKLLMGTIGVIASIALYRHFQKPSKKTFSSQFSLACRILYSLNQREVVVLTALCAAGVLVVMANISYLYSLVKNASAISLGIRIVRQISSSRVALVGIAALVGSKIFVSFFKVEISFYPFKISISRQKIPPRNVSSTTSLNSSPSSVEVPLKKKEPEEGHRRQPTIDTLPSVEIVKLPQNTPAIAQLSPVKGAPNPLLFNALAKDVFPEILRNELDFDMFYRLSLVSKFWRKCLYSLECLVPKSKTHFLSRAFINNRFESEDIYAFFDKYLPPKGQYQGEGFLFYWGSRLKVQLEEVTYLANRFPEGSFEYLKLPLRGSDDVEKIGSVLSFFLNKGKIKNLGLLHEEKSTQVPCFAQTSERLIQLLQHLQGKVPSLVLWGGWDDPSKCQSAMQKLKVANLYFLDAQNCAPHGEPFEGEELQKLSILQVRDGTMVTKMLKRAPHLKDLSIIQDSYRKIEKDDDPLRGLSLEDVRLNKLQIEVCQSKIQKEELQTVLKTQTCLKELVLRLPNFALLPTTFDGLPIERLVFACENRFFDEVALAGALSSLKSTLRTLTLEKIDFTGVCLQELQLEVLELAEIEQLQESSLHQALKGRHWKELILYDVDITGVCLEGLEVEDLVLRGNIPRLNETKLYQALLGMKNRGLKTLTISCYKGSGGVHYPEGYREYYDRDYYLKHFKLLLKKNKEFAGVQIDP